MNIIVIPNGQYTRQQKSKRNAKEDICISTWQTKLLCFYGLIIIYMYVLSLDSISQLGSKALYIYQRLTCSSPKSSSIVTYVCGICIQAFVFIVFVISVKPTHLCFMCFFNFIAFLTQHKSVSFEL